MIYVNIRGNLGNQLFTYAFARKIQKISGQKICINYYNLKKYKPEYTMNLNRYVLNENVMFEENKPLPWFANPYWLPNRIIRKIFPQAYFKIMSIFGCYMWLGVEYKNINLKEHKNYYIDGYWQSDKYFDDIKDVIIEEFKPKETAKKENEELYNLIKTTESVCITIRRGDYVSNSKYKKRFFLCDEQYFYLALEKLKKMIPNVTLFVFSDDVEWAKENLKFEQTTYYESGKDDVCEKIRLMSSCKHFIISNSSFSWWAQYLGQNKNKVVIAPSKWNVDRTCLDIYQKNWTLIDV